MLNMIKGCHIHSSQQLKEEYTHNEFTWTANVNADKIGPLVQDFIAIQASPVFFILELPCRRTEEEIWREQGIETFHKNIYYMDGLSRKKACSLLETYGELLIHDGMSSFGFGAHDHTAEIMSEKYNVVTLWSKDQTKYDTFFEAHGIQKAHHMVTAWNTFSQGTPGHTFLYTHNGANIFPLVDQLKPQGLYWAEQREEDD